MTPFFLPLIFKQTGFPNGLSLFGPAAEFDLEAFSLKLSEGLHQIPISVHLRKQDWKEISSKTQAVAIRLSPIEPPLYWKMSKTDRMKCLQTVAKSTAKQKLFSSLALEEGFYEFLLLEALHAASQIEPLEHLSLLLEEETSIPEGKAFCIDVEILFKNGSAWGELILTDTFRKAWVQHFSAFPKETNWKHAAKTVSFRLGIKIGSVQLQQDEWNALKPQDLIIPDTLSPPPTSACLTLSATSLFQAKIEHNQIEITHILFNTEDSMDESFPQKSENEEESIPIQKIPLHIHVELAQIQMTLEELLQLKPGHVLELPEYIDQQVSLTVNGKKIASAELVSIGNGYAIRLLAKAS